MGRRGLSRMKSQRVKPEPAGRAGAEAALRLSEATRSAILEAALDCIITIDNEGRVVDFNPAAKARAATASP